ncbi:MAG: hypothetical protein ACR2MS_12430 [Weeksellaceae bacterium]
MNIALAQQIQNDSIPVLELDDIHVLGHHDQKSEALKKAIKQVI